MEKTELIEKIAARVAEKLAQLGEPIEGDVTAVIAAALGGSKPGLLVLAPEHGDNCHPVLESPRLNAAYDVSCALLNDNQVDLEKIDTVVLFGLTLEAMSKIASGIVDTPYTKLAAQALLAGKTVVVPKEEIELNQYPVGGLGSYQCMLQAKLTKLVAWGVKVCPLNQLEDVILGAQPKAETASCGTAQAAAPAAPVCTEAQPEGPEKEIVFSKRVITERDIIEANRENVKVVRVTQRNILTALAKDAASARNIRLIRE